MVRETASRSDLRDDASFELSDYRFELPAESIAQRPASPRDSARLLCLDRSTGAIAHRTVADLADSLPDGAILVVNNTRVMPARLVGHKPTGGRVELLLARPSPGIHPTGLIALYSTNKRLRDGATIIVGDGNAPDVHATVVNVLGGGRARLDFEGVADVTELVERFGRVPLPPYIRSGVEAEDGQDRHDYQCLHATTDGAVAAPTAGLHFTDAVNERLIARGIEQLAITLHVGPGTFLPIRVEDLRAHRVLPERFELDDATAKKLQDARDCGRPIIAVGTTTTRVLESVVGRRGAFEAAAGDTDLTILPGYQFNAIDGLMTNFHLPESSLLVLVAAFAGRRRILNAYAEAVAKGYRFYSYGDATLIT